MDFDKLSARSRDTELLKNAYPKILLLKGIFLITKWLTRKHAGTLISATIKNFTILGIAIVRKKAIIKPITGK